MVKRLLLVYEPETACRERLFAQGFADAAVNEISSYLAQSTDILAELDSIHTACGKRGVGFQAVELQSAPAMLAAAHPRESLVWTLTDGIAYFRGGAAPALARLAGLATIGSDDSLFALCQNKFRAGAVLGAMKLPAPPAGLARDGIWLVPPPPSADGYFVKPNRLGAKIGIWPDSHCHGLDQALELSRRVFGAYRDDVIVQPYVAGRNVRASFLEVEPGSRSEALGVFFVDSGSDFQTMADSMALYGETGLAAKAEGVSVEPALVPVAASQPEADRLIREIADVMMTSLGLKDVFSLDFRVEADGTVHLIEFEVCPGLPCFDFRGYCASQWGMPLADAMAETASRRFAKLS